MKKLTDNKTLRFTKKSFLTILYYTVPGFTQPLSGPLGVIQGFFQIIPGTYKSNKPNNKTGVDKIHVKTDCIDGSIVDDVNEPNLHLSGLDEPPSHKIYKKPRSKLFKKINKSVQSHITFYSEDDDHKPVGFNEETISFYCQLVKI